MDKYKYVAGVKYKVIPNSSLGYNLVPVDEGGGDGEGGGGDGDSGVVLIDANYDMSAVTLVDPSKITEYKQKIEEGNYALLVMNNNYGNISWAILSSYYAPDNIAKFQSFNLIPGGPIQSFLYELNLLTGTITETII